MTTDFASLAGAVAAGAPGVRVCLLVSEEGLPLGAHPVADESRALAIWARLTGLGRVGRGFVTVDEEIWVISTSDHYAALAVADRAARPGVVLEHLDRVLEATEGSRLGSTPRDVRDRHGSVLEAVPPGGQGASPSGRDGSKPSRRFSALLHRDGKGGESETTGSAIVSLEAGGLGPEGEPLAAGTASGPGTVGADGASSDGSPAPAATDHTSDPAGRNRDVDAIALAREFADLLEEPEEKP